MQTIGEFSKEIKKYYLPYLAYKRLFVINKSKSNEVLFSFGSGLMIKEERKLSTNLNTTQFRTISEKSIFDKQYLIVLRPLQELSDLVETEFINYRMGMQYNEEIVNLFCLEFTHSEEKLADIDLTTLPYQCAEYFFKYGYDFFGLIPKGLAVDINTLSVE